MSPIRRDPLPRSHYFELPYESGIVVVIRHWNVDPDTGESWASHMSLTYDLSPEQVMVRVSPKGDGAPGPETFPGSIVWGAPRSTVTASGDRVMVPVSRYTVGILTSILRDLSTTESLLFRLWDELVSGSLAAGRTRFARAGSPSS